MAHFAGRREIGVKISMRASSVDPKSTQLTPLTIVTCKRKHVFQKSLKTAVPDDGNPTRALVLTKLVEWYRFELGHIKVFL